MQTTQNYIYIYIWCVCVSAYVHVYVSTQVQGWAVTKRWLVTEQKKMKKCIYFPFQQQVQITLQ